MVDVVSRPNDRGEWFSAQHEGRPVLSAHRLSAVAEDFTLFWRGRVEARELHAFFARTLPKGERFTVSAQMFTPAGKIRLDRLTSPEELEKKLTEDANFLRLEYLTQPDPRTAFDPSFIVWSRVDLRQIEPGAQAPDDIGVYMDYEHMKNILDDLRSFIEQTHIFHPSEKLIHQSLEMLAERMSSARSPLTAA